MTNLISGFLLSRYGTLPATTASEQELTRIIDRASQPVLLVADDREGRLVLGTRTRDWLTVDAALEADTVTGWVATAAATEHPRYERAIEHLRGISALTAITDWTATHRSTP